MDCSEEPRGIFLVIDNKSFYATVECTMRGLDPLTTPLVVMSEAENTNGGLVLASSPMAKKLYGISNVNRQRDLPHDNHLIVVPPRMNTYIEKNIEVNNIYREFVADEDLLPYSIDESILDITHSWKLFGDDPIAVVKKIQKTVHDRLKLVTTVGVGENPLQAKIALDVYAKHDPRFIGEITYDTVKKKIWSIPKITDAWGINERTAKRLARLGIHSMAELAHADPFILKEKMGVIGAQLYASAWRIDRTDLAEEVLPKDKSLGNSQVLPHDYTRAEEIEVVIREIGSQVASRLRAHDKQAGGVYLSIGYSLSTPTEETGFAHLLKLSDSTVDSNLINGQLLYLFYTYWDGVSPVRRISVAATRLADRYGEQLDLFNPPKYDMVKLEDTVDAIRKRFGKTSIMRASSLEKGGTFIERSQLVGGHAGGQSLE
ncbi:Y-family DNA polymerase [Limosilactobacillus fermentum]|uniref:Y-family DNA polymerase n=1 Tax=Limosilactobacillus fermentum TaxID=1613 RepID=UPI00280AA704|nr:Y-family DNA polymerase [Limosilactobacillus fermentum]